MKRFVVDEVENYTIMSNYHLRDKRLSYKARGLLSVILSLPKEWDLTQNGLVTISENDGISSVRSAMKELMDLGYVTMERIKNEHGQFVDVVYHVKMKPDNVVESQKESKTFCGENRGNQVEVVENTAKNNIPKCENPNSENPSSENLNQLNNINNKINKIIKDRMNEDMRARSVESCGKVENINDDIRESYRQLIHMNIEYDALAVDFKTCGSELDELVELMLDVLVSNPAGTTQIAGQRIKTNIVQSRFLQLRSEHIQQVLLNLSRNTTQIKNMHSYLLTCLYQSFVTTNNQIQQEINQMLYTNT